ncbi:IPT/TIG domain-containing protein [Clostridium sp.]|uniref:IPT/TIG domain-containing protein n=1 Tax=Clostridium sp. TaxID=1506 RepID=UPI00284A4144|nr:IPT/TIG domain-containing protein [Clostridium sp.]MDR3593934.1 Ig-like domain-containing protein [Clostridium sp.]
MKRIFRKGISMLVMLLMITSQFVMLPQVAHASTVATIDDVSAGDYVKYGGYTWRMLDPSSRYMITTSAVDSRQWKSVLIGFTGTLDWGSSDIVTWLNGTFFNGLSNNSWVTNYSWDGGVWTGNVALLSPAEVSSYESYIQNYSDASWTRSSQSPFALSFGYARNNRLSTPNAYYDIYPALHMNSGLTVYRGSGTEADPYNLVNEIFTANASNNSFSVDPNSISLGDSVTITAEGDRQSAYSSIVGNVTGDECYIPTIWSSDDGATASFTLSGSSYTAQYTPSTAGNHIITATYELYRWNSGNGLWEDAESTNTKTASLTVNTAAPTVTAVSPASGIITGGNTVTITGTGFTGATAVNFGSTAATSFNVVSDTEITATVPAGSAGAVDITVTTASGTSSTSSADKYTYAAIYINADRTTVSSGESVTFTTNAPSGQLGAAFLNGVYMGGGPVGASTNVPTPWSYIGSSITSDATLTLRIYDAQAASATPPDWNTPYLTEVNVVFKALTSSSVTVDSVNSLDNITVSNGTDESDIGLPATVDVELSNGATTSAAVTWDNGSPAYDGNTAGTYTFTGTLVLPDGVTNPNNYTASVRVIVQAASNETPGNNETTPAAVRIEGTTKVGDTLTAQLKDADGNNYTTSAAVTYEWYRLDNADSEFSDEIGTGAAYKLTGSDLSKYIGVRVTFDGHSFEYVIGRVLSSSSSLSHHNSSTTDTSTNTDTNKNNNNNSSSNKIGWSQETNDTWYYVKDDGSKATGWKLIDNKWYFFNDNNGAMVRGWYKSEAGDWTYDKTDTVGQWFHLDADGKLTTGWYKDTDGNWYYLCDGSDYGALGVMETGWKYINRNWYYFNANGAMASNTEVDGYTLGSYGALVE